MTTNKHMIGKSPRNESEVVTVAISNFNGRATLLETIRSARNLDYSKLRFLVVDDGSTDGSPKYIKMNFPDIKVVEIGENTGMLNMVRNKCLRESDTRLVFIVDNDMTFEPDSLRILVHALNTLPNAAVCTPRILYGNDPEKIYAEAHPLHYIGASIAKNRNANLAGSGNQPERGIGCGIQLIDKVKSELVGDFDEDYVMGWGDDGEFHHRIRMLGLNCYSVPSAIVYHNVIRVYPRVYGQIRNRWLMIIQTYSLKTLILISPALLIYEMSLFILLLFKRASTNYFKALIYILSNLPNLIRKRKQIQAVRVVPDRDLMESGTIYFPESIQGSGIGKVGMAILNGFFNAYWRVVNIFL